MPTLATAATPRPADRSGTSRAAPLRPSPPAPEWLEQAIAEMIEAQARDEHTNDAAVRVLIALTRAIGPHRRDVFTSVKRLAERSAMSPRTATSALGLLALKGTVRRTQSNRYAVAHTHFTMLERHYDAHEESNERGSTDSASYKRRCALHRIAGDRTLNAKAVRIAATLAMREEGIAITEALVRAGAATRAGETALANLISSGAVGLSDTTVRLNTTRASQELRTDNVESCARIENPARHIRDQKSGPSSAGRVLFSDEGCESAVRLNHEVQHDHRPRAALLRESDEAMATEEERENRTIAAQSRALQARRGADDNAMATRAGMFRNGVFIEWKDASEEDIRCFNIDTVGLSEEEREAITRPLPDGPDPAPIGTGTETLMRQLAEIARTPEGKAFLEKTCNTLNAVSTTVEKAVSMAEDVGCALARAISERACEHKRREARAARLRALRKARQMLAKLSMTRTGHREQPLKLGQRTAMWWRPERWAPRPDSKSAEDIVRTRGSELLRNAEGNRGIAGSPLQVLAWVEWLSEAMKETARNLTVFRGDEPLSDERIREWACQVYYK